MANVISIETRRRGATGVTAGINAIIVDHTVRGRTIAVGDMAGSVWPENRIGRMCGAPPQR
jgi:hypothetical protein